MKCLAVAVLVAVGCSRTAEKTPQVDAKATKASNESEYRAEYAKLWNIDTEARLLQEAIDPAFPPANEVFVRLRTLNEQAFRQAEKVRGLIEGLAERPTFETELILARQVVATCEKSRIDDKKTIENLQQSRIDTENHIREAKERQDFDGADRLKGFLLEYASLQGQVSRLSLQNELTGLTANRHLRIYEILSR